jgi:hypothetical protein
VLCAAYDVITVEISMSIQQHRENGDRHNVVHTEMPIQSSGYSHTYAHIKKEEEISSAHVDFSAFVCKWFHFDARLQYYRLIGSLWKHHLAASGTQVDAVFLFKESRRVHVPSSICFVSDWG